jgi:hypothetical protein
VLVDGEAPVLVAAPTPNAALSAASAERMRVANTDGVGVVLRNSPRDTDKTSAWWTAPPTIGCAVRADG